MRSSKPTAYIYFKSGSDAMAKDLARSIRAQGKETRLVSSGLFDKPEDAAVVIVQRGAAKEQRIVNEYLVRYPHVELYSVDNEGEISPYSDAPAPEATESDATPTEETSGTPAAEDAPEIPIAREVADDPVVEAGDEASDGDADEDSVTD